MKKLQRLGVGLGLAFALVSGTGYAAEFTALKDVKATPMQAEEMASVQGQGIEGLVGVMLGFAHNLQSLNGGKQTPFLYLNPTPTKAQKPSLLSIPIGGPVRSGSPSPSQSSLLSRRSG
jgi:hypothetical protein